MRYLLAFLVLIIFLTSCQKISNSDRIEMSNLAKNYFDFPKFMGTYYNSSDEMFKVEMNAKIDSLFASPLKEVWHIWIQNGALGSCYFSDYTKLVVNREVYQDTIVISSNNEIQYKAKVYNSYSYISEYDSINFMQFKDQNITNTTYELPNEEVDALVKEFTHFGINVTLKEKVILEISKSDNGSLISSIENEILEMEVEVILDKD